MTQRLTDTPTVTVAEYLATRLGQLGVEHLFGVPGDFNLLLLEELQELGAPRWVGTANELGAAYAADGYARERGVGALLTTYGVGELSAINGVAGSYAEQVPVLHIAGAPMTAAMRDRLPLHHTLLDGDALHFARAYAEVTVAQVMLGARADAGAEIDRVLRTMLDTNLPGYLAIPEDVVRQQVDAAPLATPLAAPASVPGALADLTRRVHALLSDADQIVVLAGAGVSRAGCELQLRDLAQSAALPVATLLDAKGLIDERHPCALGVYQGAIGAPATRRAVEDAEILVRIGARLTDSLTGGFTAQLDGPVQIEIGLDHVVLGGETIAAVRMHDALAVLRTVLADRIATAAASPLADDDAPAEPAAARDEDPAASVHPSAPLTQEFLWRTVAERLPHDATVLADAGTSFYGIGAEQIGRGVRVIGQPVWSSIGYCLPATLGVGLARSDRRAVLLTGDGAAQMTIQELGTIARQGLHPIVLLVDNDGYTIERAIRGPESAYNDITRWDWRAVVEGLTAGSGGATVLNAATAGELADALDLARALTDRLVFVHVRTDRQDVPAALRAMTGALARRAG